MDNLNKEGVSSGVYNKEWIAKAWGKGELRAIKETGWDVIRPRLRFSLELSKLKPDMKILDVGCGKGDVLAYCARRGVCSFGIDYSSDMLEFIRKNIMNLKKDYINKISLCQSDAKELPFKDSSFDRIFLLDIVEHLYDRELNEMFKEVKRVLKDSGYAVIHTLPNKWAYNYGYRILRFFNPNLSKDPRSDLEKKGHVNEQSIISLHSLLKNNGFRFRIWLEDMIIKQARWKYKSGAEGELRGDIYYLLNRPLIGFLYKIINISPLRLIFSNDIYSVAWKKETQKVSIPRTPSNLIDGLFIFALIFLILLATLSLLL